MRLSKLFTKSLKDVKSQEKSANAQYLERAGFINKEMSGVYTYLPLGLMMLRNITSIIREEMNKIDGQEILMPTLTSLENYKKTDRAKLEILFKTKLHTGSEFVLNQSHEEVVTPLVGKYARSYKDLPVYVYQIQTKFRNEPRAKSGLLRGREFLMKDLYSFHTDKKDLDEYYEKVKGAYFNIFERIGLGNGKTVLTYASGGSFSKYSHEFQTICETGEDEIYLCKKCNIAVNKEIVDQQKTCPECGNSKLEKTSAIEVGNIFKLNERFSKAFGYKYTDKNGKEKPVIMGCYGIGPSRIMGAVVEAFHDKKGMKLTESVAPFKYHVVLIGENLNIDKINDIYEKLGGQKNILLDDRDISAGEKFADADLMGMPYRVVISKKTLEKNSVEVKKRDSDKIELINIDELKKG